ncbi:TPA: hypothetical protein ACGD48_000073 [Serratia marcescens]|uniref:hypothetical protein n=1 Tax=Serratia marcescens TaxID=615 RepID=UPI001868C28E|nr:hypothetical protein [Serratia marcescens]CAI1512488.1 Uncharacterised protein [Serratia marcescens]CAI1720872.1 Uncharacterised protein [Serratia marcescens]CAJ0994258.1 hypothetical protein NVIRSERR_01351 [Serratia marcescens]BEN34266.1 hypothetical protein SMKC041_08980 [Serratia marcescens]HAT4914902.1 hypothetical protein [Serratia marcescens]
MDRRDILRNAGCSLAALFTVDVLALGNKEGGDIQSKEAARITPFINERRSFSGNLVTDSIVVSSRDELIAAQDFIIKTLGKRTEIHLAKDFKPWIAERTDIDLAFVTLVGHADGTVIDASGIPDAEGNYFLRFYNSGALDIERLPNLGGTRMLGVLVQGPGRDSKVIGRLFHSPEGQLGNIVLGAVTLTEFGRGDVYQTNAYNISHFGAQIFRSGVHVDMPSGFPNCGENITYFGGVIATSAGIAVRNSNANGEFYLSGVSIDYVGRVLEANAGSIVVHGGHHEFNNQSSPLKSIPYFCGGEQSASIVIRDVTIMGSQKEILPVDAVVESIAGSGGVYFYGCRLLNLLTQQEVFKIGEGIFSAMDSRLLDGKGNFAVSLLLSQAENQLSDGDFSSAESGDWVAFSEPSAREEKPNAESSDNLRVNFKLQLAKDKSLQLTKLADSGVPLTLYAMAPSRRLQNYTYSFKIVGDGIAVGKIYVAAFFVSVSYLRENGIVSMRRKLQHGPVREIDLASLDNNWKRIVQSPLRMQAPEWATHYMLVVDAKGMSSGSFHLSDALITSI